MESVSVARLHVRKTFSIASYLFLIPIVSIGLLLRLHSLGFVTESLWYEDGAFITQAYSLGIESVWTPFSYLFVYHRLVALIARELPLIWAPYIFFVAWLFVFFLIVWVLKSRAKLIDIDPLSVLLVILAITFQPSQGEAWFNLNQSHCTLGIALSLYVCIPTKKPASVTEILFLLIASLSDVSSIVLTMVLVLQLILLRDFSVRKATYILVPAGALVEGVFLFSSHRVQQGGVDLKLEDWLHVVWTLLTFGGTSIPIYVISILFWTVTLIYVVRWSVFERAGLDRIPWLSPLFAIAVAALMFFVSGVAEGSGLRDLNPMDMESRYCLVPYSLLFFAAFVCTKDRKSVQIGLACLVGIICALEFVTVDRDDREASTGLLAHTNMQWTAFAKFQEIKSDLVIPINSPLPIYPPEPFVQISRRAEVRESSFVLTPGLQSAALGPTLQFDIGKYCPTNKYIGLEFDIWRERMGAARVNWTDGRSVSSEKSLDRFYPAGPVTMQFAFRRDISDSIVEFYPALGVADSRVVRTFTKLRSEAKGTDTSLYPGATFAERTPAGGKVKIEQTRVFCLE